MKQFQTVDDILDFAIDAEQESVDFYSGWATRSRNEDMKKVFTEFAKEEMTHKSLLITVKESHSFNTLGEKVRELNISDYLTDVVASSNMTYADALLLAMKKEKNAYRLYMMLSEAAEETDLKALFLKLATEESKHKLKFEVEYDEYILREN